jgi:hypothetical protein
MDRIELGDRVKDKISGLKGIAVAITQWLYGCRRVTIQPEELKDGKPVDNFTADEPQLDVVKKGVLGLNVMAKVSPAGGRENIGRNSDPKR